MYRRITLDIDMDNSSSLGNHFLIAMPNLNDPNFSRTVTLICQHNDEGAMGITVNRPSDITVSEVLSQLHIQSDKGAHMGRMVCHGGPVQNERGFVLHSPLGQWESTLAINDELGISTSKDILSAIADGNGPESWLLTLGYAGWGPGQLEQEMAANAWLNGPAEQDIIFNTPADQRWEAAAKHLGVNLSNLSSDTGHA